MTKLKLLGAALAMTISTAALAATAAAGCDCCKDAKPDCCKDKDGKKMGCCDKAKGMKDGDHAGHDMSRMEQK